MIKWISVEDELPPKELNVLAVQKIENEFSISVYKEELFFKKIPDHFQIITCYLDKKDVFYYSKCNQKIKRPITHWQKFPLIKEFIKDVKPNENDELLILQEWKDYYYVRKGIQKLPEIRFNVIIGRSDTNRKLTYINHYAEPHIMLTGWLPLPKPPQEEV